MFCRAATDAFAYEPALSVANVSIAVSAVRAAPFALASWALFLWLKNAGIAIAARRPRMIMTTRSSISVKPDSSWAILCRILRTSLPFCAMALAFTNPSSGSCDPSVVAINTLKRPGDTRVHPGGWDLWDGSCMHEFRAQCEHRRLQTGAPLDPLSAQRPSSSDG